MAKRGNNAVGCTRPATSSTKCPNPCGPKPRGTCRTSGWQTAFDFFVKVFGTKYHRAVERLTKDRERLLTFYDFPAEHWKHIRTTNPIESTVATVRLRTVKTKGCLSRKTALAMVFKLILSAKRKWLNLDGSN